ncbi:hypothetical protein JXA88_13065 [Candidatus Fermentibacteria bacterium]|nr:hypothetical protein [Candidatus Fermentibacteria bacterium]
MIPLILALVGTAVAPDSLLARAGFNRPVWESALEKLGGIEQERGVWLLGELRDLDLMEIDEATILAHVQGCSRAMAYRPDYAVSEDTLRAFILHPRAGHYDMVTDWRTDLWATFRDACRGDFEHDVPLVLSLLRDRIIEKTRADALGPPSPPEGTFRRGWGSAEEWASLAVASLRTVGIAARLCHAAKGVEAWDGAGWRRVHHPGLDSPKAETAQTLARLELRLTEDGQPLRNTEQLGLSRWREGAWRPVEAPVHRVFAEPTDTSILISAPPGEYLVTAGVRNARGEPRIWCREVTLSVDTLLTLTENLTIPFAEMDRRDLVESPAPVLESIVLRDSLGAEVTLDSFIRGGRPVLIVAVEPGSELSERLRPALVSSEAELEALGVVTMIVTSADTTRATLWNDSRGALWAALELDRGRAPAVVLISAGGEVLLFKRRAGPHTVELVVASLRGTPEG